MRKQPGDVELIEVFAPDDAAAWSDIPAEESRPTTPVTARRKSRRGVVVGGALVAVAFAASTVALIDDTKSDSAVTTTLAATPTTMRAPLDPTAPTHFLLDEPTLTPYSADIVTPPANTETVHVWTDGTATGPIVIIELHPYSRERYGIVGATRIEVDGYELAELKIYCANAAGPSDKRCELLISERAIDQEWSVTVRATRSSRGVVSRIASSAQVIDGVLAVDSDLMEMLGLGLTFAANSLDDLIFGRVETAVRYLTVGGEFVTLRSGFANRPPEHWLAGIRYLVTDAQPSFYDRTYGYMMDTGEAFVAWEEEGRFLSLVGPGDPGDLAILSRQVRPATDAEWSAMVYGLRPDFRVGEFATLARGETSTSEPWRAGVQLAERAGVVEFLWWWTVPGSDDFADSTPASDGVGTQPHLDTLVVPGATFVFVSQPGRTGTVTVRTTEGIEYTAELTAPFPTLTKAHIAVVRVEEPGPLSVEIDGVAVNR
ncbi:MAG: hypothetical protein ABL953_09145 [Ilumatobacteraceae bacterium]